jgi:hypothetical protein
MVATLTSGDVITGLMIAVLILAAIVLARRT